MRKEITFQALDWSLYENNIVCFGRDINGKSISIKIRGCNFPFYINVSKWNTEKIRLVLNHLKLNRIKTKLVKRRIFGCILKEENNTLMDTKTKFIKVENSNSKDFYIWRRNFKNGFDIDGFKLEPCRLYNTQIKPELMFFHIHGFSCNGWFNIYRYNTCKQFSNSDINLEIHVNNLNEIENCKEKSKYIIASYDIETEGTTFEIDRVFQIGITFKDYYRNIETRVLLSLNKCGDVEDTIVKSFDTEEKLMKGFVDTLLEYDFDILTGFNTFGFDNNFIYQRLNMLGCSDYLKKLSRIPSFGDVMYSKISGKSNGYGNQHTFNIIGRVQMDVMKIIYSNYKLSSYSLSNISKKFLKDDKIELPYKEMFRLWDKGKGSPKDLAIIGEYCVKDTILPIDLIDKLSLFINASEYTNISYFPLRMSFIYGENQHSWSQICRQSEVEKYVILDKKRKGTPFKGATVLEPKIGMYVHDKIAVLDFKSLYPSIMIAFNLCPTTLCMDENIIEKYPEKFYTINNNGVNISFYKDKIGIVPTIMKRLLMERVRVKKQMKNEKDLFLQGLYNSKQLALKISCNSIYGFFGVTDGIFPCTEISSTTTFIGRNMIDETKKYVELGYEGTEVIYGDTDSVMVKMPRGKTDEELFALGEKIGKELTQTIYRSPNELEFEKLYDSFILYSKKHYSGIMRENINQTPVVDDKGIPTVRRDTTDLTKDILRKVLNTLHYEKNTIMAVTEVKQYIFDILDGKLPYDKFIMSKGLGKGYKNQNIPHNYLSKKINERSGMNVYVPGDRVKYVFFKDHTIQKNTKQYLRVEDPDHVKENGMKIDYRYYIEKQISNPILDCTKFIDSDLKMFFNDINIGGNGKFKQTSITEFFK